MSGSIRDLGQLLAASTMAFGDPWGGSGGAVREGNQEIEPDLGILHRKVGALNRTLV